MWYWVNRLIWSWFCWFYCSYVHKSNNVKEDSKKVTVHMSGRAYERVWVSSIRGVCMEIEYFSYWNKKYWTCKWYWEVADLHCLVKCFWCFILVDYKLMYCAVSLDQNLWDWSSSVYNSTIHLLCQILMLVFQRLEWVNYLVLKVF